MLNLSYTQARATLARTMTRVCQDQTPVLITRQNQESVIMMSLSDYESLEETAHLLRSPRNARRLLESIEQFEAGRGKTQSLADQGA